MLFNLVSIICIILYYILYEFDSQSYHEISIIIFFCQVGAYYLSGRQRETTIYTYWLRPTYILFGSMIIVNLQTIMNVILEFAPLSFYLNTKTYDSYIGKTLYLSLMAMSAFLVGNYNTQKKTFGIFLYQKPKIANTSTLKLWSFFCLIMFICFIVNIDIMAFMSGQDYIGSGAVDRIRSKSMYFEQLLEVGIIITFSIYIYNLSKKYSVINLKIFLTNLPKIFSVVLICYLLLRLLSGDRGPVIYTICIFLFSYLYVSKKRANLVSVIGVAILGAVMVSLLGFTRNLTINGTFSERFVSSMYDMQQNENRMTSILPMTQELANSVKCNLIAVADIENEKTDFKNGEYTLYNIVGAIPGSRYILTQFFDIDIRDKSSAEYLTISFLGRNYSYGLGTAAIAEPYLDFGIIGTCIYFLFFGVFFKKIDICLIKAHDLSIIELILLLRFASYSIYIPRFSFAGTLSKALYVIIIYVILDFIFRLIKKV